MSNTILSHYGVPGMKWGVRKKMADRRVADYRNKIQSRAIRDASKTVDYKSLSDKDIDLGKNFNRVSGVKENTVSNRTYVTNSKTDHDRYVALLSPNNGTGKTKFETKISTVNNLVSPSEKKRIDTYLETLDRPVLSMDQRSLVKGRAYLEYNASDKALSTRDLGLLRYRDFAQSQGANTPLHSAYFDAIKAKGYKALVDDADRGLVSDIPIILFGDLTGAKVTSSRQLSKEEIADTQINLKDL